MKLLKTAAWLLCTAMAVTACNEHDHPHTTPDAPAKDHLPAAPMFVLNQGTWGANNANILCTAADFDLSVPDIFFDRNQHLLGDTGNAILRHGDNMFVAMNTSNCLYKLDCTGQELACLSFADTPELQGGLRYIAADAVYVYATFYGGYVAKIEASTCQLADMKKISDSNLEGIAVLNGHVYVADSYARVTNSDGSTAFVYNNSVFVLDNNLNLSNTITTAPNPNKLLATAGRLFIISWGDYATCGNLAQVYDPATGTLQDIGEAYAMTCADTDSNENVLFMASTTDWTTYTTSNSYFVYNALAQSSTPILQQYASMPFTDRNVSMLAISRYSGDIYIGVTYYADSDGDLYRFDAQGNLLGSIDSCGQHPVGAVFYE